MTGRATTPRSRTTLTGTWLLALALLLAPALSDVCAAMCAMPMASRSAAASTMRMAMRGPAAARGAAHADHHEHRTDAAHAAAPDADAARPDAAARRDVGGRHEAAMLRGVAAHHDHCGAANPSTTFAAPDVASTTGATDGHHPASPFVLNAAHHCLLHAPAAPSSTHETRALAVRTGATDDARVALTAAPTVATVTFVAPAATRSAPLPALDSASGLASARPLRVPLRI